MNTTILFINTKYYECLGSDRSFVKVNKFVTSIGIFKWANAEKLPIHTDLSSTAPFENL
jgi:hypothetical protein